MRGLNNILSFVLVLVSIHVVAQETDPQKLIESIIESHLDKIDAQTDIALIIEDLEGFLENPININATTASELSRLYIFNDIQINKILSYLETLGPAYSIYEFNTIDGLTAHAGRNELLSFFNNMRPKPKRIIINHGEVTKSLDLASALYKLNRVETNVPRTLETLRLR